MRPAGSTSTPFSEMRPRESSSWAEQVRIEAVSVGARNRVRSWLGTRGDRHEDEGDRDEPSLAPHPEDVEQPMCRAGAGLGGHDLRQIVPVGCVRGAARPRRRRALATAAISLWRRGGFARRGLRLGGRHAASAHAPELGRASECAGFTHARGRQLLARPVSREAELVVRLATRSNIAVFEPRARPTHVDSLDRPALQVGAAREAAEEVARLIATRLTELGWRAALAGGTPARQARLIRGARLSELEELDGARRHAFPAFSMPGAASRRAVPVSQAALAVGESSRCHRARREELTLNVVPEKQDGYEEPVAAHRAHSGRAVCDLRRGALAAVSIDT